MQAFQPSGYQPPHSPRRGCLSVPRVISTEAISAIQAIMFLPLQKLPLAPVSVVRHKKRRGPEAPPPTSIPAFGLKAPVLPGRGFFYYAAFTHGTPSNRALYRLMAGRG
jgi:hypothetical protein